MTLFPCRNDNLNVSELTVKLEPAFLSGLRSSQVTVRAKFFEVSPFSNYLMCTYTSGPQAIKQCLVCLCVSVQSPDHHPFFFPFLGIPCKHSKEIV